MVPTLWGTQGQLGKPEPRLRHLRVLCGGHPAPPGVSGPLTQAVAAAAAAAAVAEAPRTQAQGCCAPGSASCQPDARCVAA